MVGLMATSFERPSARTAPHSAPDPAAGHCQSMPQLEPPGHSWASLGQALVGSLVLSPGSWCTQGFVCALQESVSQSCVSSGTSMVELTMTSSKRAYAIPRSAAPRAPASAAGQCLHRRHSDTVLAKSLGLGMHFAPFLGLQGDPTSPS